MSTEINERLQDLENQIQTTYKSYSVVGTVCTTKSISQSERFGQFRQFANKLLIERRHITDPSHHLILDEIGRSVARNEIKYLVNNLQKGCKQTTTEKISYRDIQEGVSSIQNSGFVPNHIFLPIEYFHEVFEWNKDKPRTYDATKSAFNSLYISESVTLSVDYSNKYIQFDDSIITSKEANFWEYRPTSSDNERLISQFCWDQGDDVNTILLVQTIFNLHVKHPEGNFLLSKEN